MRNTRQNTRGFIDPITLGFLISLVGTTTALTVRDTNQIESSANTVNNIEVQAVAAIQIEDDFDF